MILTDREIQLAIVKQLIIIDPRPEAQAISSTAVDLTLGTYVNEFKNVQLGTNELIIDPSDRDFQLERTLAQISEKRVIDVDDGYLLKPNSFVLAWTKEHVTLASHSRIAARVEGKNSLARFGVGVHVTGQTIYAGFVGHLCLEVFNYGKVPIRLRNGMRICQLIFEQMMGTPGKGYPLDFLSVRMKDTF